MSTPVIAFFNNKGGVGNTSMVYHLAWMFSDRGLRVIAADLDPQSNLTAAFLDEDRLEDLLSSDDGPLTVYGAVLPLKRGTGDIADAHVEVISERLGLILGDMTLSTFEDELSEVWAKCLDRDERAFRVVSAFWRIVQKGAADHQADVILIDLGPNLGAINRAALIASDFVVIPLKPDLFSLQGLQDFGPFLRRWREEWRARLPKNPVADLDLPVGDIQPIGYILLRQILRLDRPVQSFQKWIARMPSTYIKAVLDNKEFTDALTIDTDPNCIGRLKDYRSLMPLAEEARKPMFFLKPADGALGAYTYAVQEAYKSFRSLAIRIAESAGLKTLS